VKIRAKVSQPGQMSCVSVKRIAGEMEGVGGGGSGAGEMSTRVHQSNELSLPGSCDLSANLSHVSLVPS